MAIILSLGGLVLTMSTSMMAPALMQIGSDMEMAPSTTQVALSIYVLSLGVGPLVITPFSEMYGRKPLWIIYTLWYILFNTLYPVGRSKGLMIAGRFLAGLGASVGVAVSTLIPQFNNSNQHESDSWTVYGGYLKSQRSREVSCHSHLRTLPRCRSWAYHSRLYLPGHKLALAILDCIHLRRGSPDHGDFLHQGVFCPRPAEPKSTTTSKEHRQELSLSL